MQKTSAAAVFAAISIATSTYAQQSGQTLSPTEAKAIATDTYLYSYPMLYLPRDGCGVGTGYSPG